MIPPTPTPMPAPGIAPITLPDSYTMWTFADDAVGWWHTIGGTGTQIVQVIVIAVIVFVALVIIVNQLRGSGSEEKDPAKK